MPFKPAPLNTSFMLTAILGFLISVVYVRKIDLSWAFAFALVFLIMLIASLVSMAQAPVRGQLMPKLEKEFKGEEAVEKEVESLQPKKLARKKPKKKKR